MSLAWCFLLDPVLNLLFGRPQEWTKSSNLCQHAPTKYNSPQKREVWTMDKALYDRGMAMRRKVLGDEYVDRAVANTDDFNRKFQDLLNEFCWGAVWTDEDLKPRDRSLLNLGMIACLGRMHEFEAHFRGALRNGLTPKELSAVLRQVAIYCGFPAAVDAHRVAKQVLAAEAKKT
jgi:4-carboxymuconolactone decarboxylase